MSCVCSSYQINKNVIVKLMCSRENNRNLNIFYRQSEGSRKTMKAGFIVEDKFYEFVVKIVSEVVNDEIYYFYDCNVFFEGNILVSFKTLKDGIDIVNFIYSSLKDFIQTLKYENETSC